MPSKIVELQRDFHRGIHTDVSRDNMPQGSVWDTINYFPSRLGSPLEKRGGWDWVASELPMGAARLNTIMESPFNGGVQLIITDVDGHLYRIFGPHYTSGDTWAIDGVTEDVGLIQQAPILYDDTLLIPSPDGTATMNAGNEVQIVPYAPTDAQKGTFITEFKNRIVTALDETLQWGPPIDALITDPWDPTATYKQTQPILGLYGTDNQMLFWFAGRVMRVRGDTPAGYGVEEGNLVFETLFNGIGLIDAFTICEWDDRVIWADKQGIYMTDGAVPVNLFDEAQCHELWNDFMDDFVDGTDRIACGVLDNFLFASVTNGEDGTERHSLVCDLEQRIFVRMENFSAACYARSTQGKSELWFAGPTRPVQVAQIFHPTQNTDSDADDYLIEPLVQLPYHRIGPGRNRIIDLYVAYEMESGQDLDPGTPAENASFVYEGAIQLVAILEGTAGNDFVFTLNTSDAILEIENVFELPHHVTVNAPNGTTAQDIVTAMTSAFGSILTISVVAGHEGDSFVDASGDNAFTPGVDAVPPAISTAQLVVCWSEDPNPDPTYHSYDGVTNLLDNGGIDGVGDEGYHYKRMPVNLDEPGLSVQIRQQGGTGATRIFGVSVDIIPEPAYRQR